LEILPRLRQGVLVQIHDIFIPYDYPEEWVLDDWGWTEQYLVHAFLCYNYAFEILWPASYMWDKHQPEIKRVIPNLDEDIPRPSSLWLRKVLS
jgi:hypothetical protein